MVAKRLWKAGGLLAALILPIILANFFLAPGKAFERHMYGHDFLPFYTAGQIVRMGQVDRLYDPQMTRQFEHQTCREAGLVIHNEYGAFLNPPFAALPAAFLARWPYTMALWIWTALLALVLLASIVLLIHMLPPASPWQMWGLIPLLLFTTLPAWQAMLHAQNTFFSLLILSAVVTCWRKNQPLYAGLWAGLLFFKPQLAAVVAIVLIATQGRRAALGLALTVCTLLLASAIALPGSLAAYVHQLPVNLRAIQQLPNYTWHRHITFLAWWRMLLQGHGGALPTPLVRTLAGLCSLACAAALAAAVWRTRKTALRSDRLIAATITVMPLCMPYYMDYDLTLLAIAAVLCAADAIRFGIDSLTLYAWIAFYGVIEVNPAIAGATVFIPAVPALAFLSMALIRNAPRPMAAAQIQPSDQSPAMALAA